MNGFENFIDTRTIDTGAHIETDLCIIGSGAAGITLAREFAKSGTRVALLETGGFNYEADVAALGTIEVVGRPYPVENCRLRYFGGTTNHWGGHCSRLEAIDFEEREWVPESGWPFGRDDLMPFYERANQVIEIGGNDYDAESIAKKLNYRLFPFDPKIVRTTLSRYHAQRFGLRYGHELDAAGNITAYLYATVTSIDLDPGHRFVSGVTVKTLAGNTITFSAKRFVLATGGLENARLLLDSTNDQPNGLGNGYDLVGRYFMEHIAYPRSVIRPPTMDPAYDIYTGERPFVDGVPLNVRCHLALHQDLTRELRIPKFRTEIGLTLMPFTPPLSMDDVATLMERAGAKIARTVTGGPWKPTCYELLNYTEQVPNPVSRILLSTEKNALGQHLTKMDWRLTSLGRAGIRKAHQIIAHEVGRSGFGRFMNLLPDDAEEDSILDGAVGGMHHMGTTRMHNDPKRGVVDANCKMHGLENIYIAGSSVFPSCGWPNPTLTITALALRLADHLKGEMMQDG